MEKRFKMIDENFTCVVCGKEITKLKYTARDHCPHCFSSLHLDVFPGDRKSDCKGVLVPIGIETNKKGMQIVYRCEKCGEIKKNITAKDDDMDMIIKLSARPLEY